MADDKSPDQKTEDPTARRLQKALEEGQIAFSSELLGGLILLTAVIFFLLAGKWFFDSLSMLIRQRVSFMEKMIAYPETILLAFRRDIEQAGLLCAAIVLPIMAVVLAAGFMQTRFNLTLKPLALNWGRLQPANGFKRIFSTRSVNRGAIAIAKAASIGIAAWFITRSRMGEIANSGKMNLEHTLAVAATLILAIGFLSAALMVVAGLADYVFQYFKQRQDLKMTLQEIRDENKDVEGDPLVKARLRRIANEISKKRTLEQVPKATVLVTNPTHFAVALRYEPGESEAPVVIAKGADFLAKRMIAEAEKHGVAVVERKPVARFLYANVNEGQEIPYEMFQAVAEILNFIKKLNAA